jgi:hypothetical protein
VFPVRYELGFYIPEDDILPSSPILLNLLTLRNSNATGEICTAEGFKGSNVLAICARCCVLDIHVQSF